MKHRLIFFVHGGIIFRNKQMNEKDTGSGVQRSGDARANA